MSTVLFGKVEVFNGRRQMTNPVVDLVGDKTGRIVAMYPQSETKFESSGAVAEFVVDASGTVTRLVLSQTEGDSVYEPVR